MGTTLQWCGEGNRMTATPQHRHSSPASGARCLCITRPRRGLRFTRLLQSREALKSSASWMAEGLSRTFTFRMARSFGGTLPIIGAHEARDETFYRATVRNAPFMRVFESLARSRKRSHTRDASLKMRQRVANLNRRAHKKARSPRAFCCALRFTFRCYRFLKRPQNAPCQ